MQKREQIAFYFLLGQQASTVTTSKWAVLNNSSQPQQGEKPPSTFISTTNGSLTLE